MQTQKLGLGGEVRAEVVDEVEDEGVVGDLFANIAHGISEILESPAVACHRHVALEKAPQLHF